MQNWELPNVERREELLMSMNRRRFLRVSSASAAALAMHSVASGLAPAAPQARFRLGLGTYTFRLLDISGLIGRCRELNLSAIELSHPQYMLPQADLKVFASVRGELASGRVDLVSWFCGHLSKRVEIEALVEGARLFGVKMVSGAAEREMLDDINTACGKAGLAFGIHNHYFPDRKFTYESPEDVLSALEGRPNLFSTLDTGHMIAVGVDPTEAYRKLKPHVRIIHIKDEDTPGHSVVLGKGKGNIGQFLQTVARDSFPGLCAIEYEEGTDPKQEVSDCIRYIRTEVRLEG
jgi:sugar phosphate isomerase/epimerase